MQSRTAAEEQIKSNIRRLVGAFYFVVLCRQADVEGVSQEGGGRGYNGTDSGTCRRVQQSKAAQRLQTAGLELSLATYECQNEKRKQIAHTYRHIYTYIYLVYIYLVYICNEVGRQVGRIIMRSAPAKVFTFDCISFAL